MEREPEVRRGRAIVSLSAAARWSTRARASSDGRPARNGAATVTRRRRAAAHKTNAANPEAIVRLFGAGTRATADRWMD